MATETTISAPLRRRVRLSGRSLWILYPILLFLTFSAWAVSSPAGSSPDEDFHLASVWCAWGPRPGMCETWTDYDNRLVPAMVLDAACYRFLPEASGQCPPPDPTMAATTRGNFTDYYPNGFYVVMAVFSGPSMMPGVLLMRLLNAAIYTLSLAALLALSRPERRGIYMLGSLVTIVPLSAFIIPAVNPSSWAVTAATLLWASAFEFGKAPHLTRRIQLGILVTVAMALGVFSRADSAVFSALALGLAWLVIATFNRRTLVVGGIVAIVGATVMAWASTLKSATQALNPDQVGAARPDAWFSQLRDLMKVYFGGFGTSGLGWLDTRMPAAVWVLAGGIYAMVLFWGLRRCHWRKGTALLLTFVGSSAVMMALASIRNAAMWIFQPRYFLPLLIMVVVIALAADNDKDEDASPPLLATGAIVGSLAIAHAVALHTNLRRYVTGLDVAGFDLDHNIEWWWPWPPSPMTVFWLGSIAFLGAALVVGHQLRRRLRPDRA